MRFHQKHSVVAVMLGAMLVSLPADAGTFPASNRKEYRAVKHRVWAAQFLTRATFGPTEAEIDALSARIAQIGKVAACEEWIDKQFETDINYHAPLAREMAKADGYFLTQSGVGISRYRQYAFWDNAMRAEDQLRQRMAWALIQIFVIGDTGPAFNSQNSDYGNPDDGLWLGMAKYNDMLLDNAFGNYRKCLYDVSLSPMMGEYLSHVRNRKANPNTGREPDENYAREVQQLKSIGIHKLRLNGTIVHDDNGDPIEIYDNEDIKAFARVFTGLTHQNDDPNRFFGPRNYTDPMMMVEREHDTDEKVLHNGTVLAAGQSGLEDIHGALDNLFEHPNCPPFMARRLIQRLIKSNPSKGYIRRVARTFIDNGEGVRGDFRAVLKAIYLDREAMKSLRFQRIRDDANQLVGIKVLSRGTEWSRLREPVIRYTAMLRALNASSTDPIQPGLFLIPSQNSNMQQAPYQAPHVFNFYEVDFKPQGELLSYVPSRRIPNGELVAPEFEILTGVTANRMTNRYQFDIRDQKADFSRNTMISGRVEMDVLLDISKEIALAGEDPAALMQHLDLLLCHGTMHDSTREIIATIITEETTNATVRAEEAILATLTSPDSAISE